MIVKEIDTLPLLSSPASPVHGWLIIDKPLGITSARVVSRVKKTLNLKKIGHGGTLDPLASGILPLALGEATKTVSYIMNGIKTYHFTIKWGEATDTGDAEGEVVATSPNRPHSSAVETALSNFTGTISQIPPLYSALKIRGRPAYPYARKKEPLILQPRMVTIKSLRVIPPPCQEYASKEFISLEAVCGKGTYIRSLGRDIAQTLNTCGHLVALRRTQVGPFKEHHAISLDNLDVVGHIPEENEKIVSIAQVLDDIPALTLDNHQARLLRFGQMINLYENQWSSQISLSSETALCLTLENQPIGLVRLEKGYAHPIRIFNL